MFTLTVSTLVDLPLAHVFAYVADFRNAPAWQRRLLRVRLDDGPFPRYGFAAEAGGTRVTLDLTVAGRGPARLLEPVLRRSLERELRTAFQRLATSVPVP